MRGETGKPASHITLKDLRGVLADTHDIGTYNTTLRKIFDDKGLTDIAPLLRGLTRLIGDCLACDREEESQDQDGRDKKKRQKRPRGRSDQKKTPRRKESRRQKKSSRTSESSPRRRSSNPGKTPRRPTPGLRSGHQSRSTTVIGKMIRLLDQGKGSSLLSRSGGDGIGKVVQRLGLDKKSPTKGVNLSTLLKKELSTFLKKAVSSLLKKGLSTLLDAGIQSISKSRGALLQKATDSLKALGAALGETLLPVLDVLVPAFISLTKGLTDLIRDVPQVGRVIRAAVVTLGGLFILRKLGKGLAFLRGDKTTPGTGLASGGAPVPVYIVGGCLDCYDQGGGSPYDQNDPDRRRRQNRSSRRDNSSRRSGPNRTPGRPTNRLSKMAQRLSRGNKFTRLIGRAISGVGQVARGLGLDKAARGLGLDKAAGGLGKTAQRLGLGKAAGFLGRVGGGVGKAAGFLGRVGGGVGKATLGLGMGGARLLGRLGGPLLTAATYLPEAIDAAATGDTERLGGALGGMGGTFAGAAAGAAIGSVVPVIGTAIGGIIGGMVGSYGGDMAGSWIGSMFAKTEEKAKTDQDAAAAADANKAAMAAKTVTNNNTYNISASPLDDPEAVARKVAQHTAEKTRGALYDIA